MIILGYETKDLIFYPLVTLALIATVKSGFIILWLVQELKLEAPECMGSNP